MPATVILGDWGTSRLRLFRIENGAITDQCEGAGIAASTMPPRDVLLSAVQRWRAPRARCRVVLCGMVGSRNGLIEVPYAEMPGSVATWAQRAARFDLDGLDVTIAAGLACRRANGASDVMRGEETQLFGAMALAPELARGRHFIGLPGTHAKWASVVDGQVTAFRTYLTGELFALLRDRSTLLRAGNDDRGGDEGFAAGVARAAAEADLAGSLFETRAAQLRDDRSQGWAAGFLSGLLIGDEVRRACAGASEVTLIGAPALTARYRAAMRDLPLTVTERDGDSCALAGLNLLVKSHDGADT